MKKKSSQSAFFNLRILIGLFVFLSGVCLALAGLGTFSNAPRQSGGKSPAATKPSKGEAIQFTPADKDGRFVYLIEFAEKGMLHREARAPGESFSPNTPQAQRLRDQIIREQANHVQAIAQALGRIPDVTHRFLVTHSGIATRLTPEEAQIVRGLSGIRSVERERLYHTTTYRGPTFIGADQIWDGTAVPPGSSGTRGEGIVIAMLDTGVDPAHPSFANDPDCGHGTTQPNKLLSFLDCSSTDPGGLCNGPNPIDTNGHGTHTSSTSGGNALDGTAVPPPQPPAPFTEITGVAPCASIRSYKVCPTNNCPEADIQAGMNSVLLQGDPLIMNFSISGGTQPWIDNDRRKLDLVAANVLVAASAGNTSAGVPDPVGNVNHRGPWVFTVAASTRDFSNAILSATGPGVPPPDTQNILLTRGSDSPFGDPLNDFPIRHFTGQDPNFEGCNGQPPFPPNFFAGAAALIHRGNCTFTEKITNAFLAGAELVLIRNNQPGTVSMSTPDQPDVPAYSMDQIPGNALVAFVDANPDTATIDFELAPGDVLAGFSLRGPDPAPLQDLTKPDITAPGVGIYAAAPLALGAYASLSGTSMSSPHTAGSAALVRKVHPTWTVTEVKSAIMMTAFNGGTKENGLTPWDADDVGNGRVDLTKAALAGLVMDETIANYLAANPAIGGDPKTLNLPSVRNMTCSPNCTWTRTVRNTVPTPTNWSASGNNITPGFEITVQPTNFSFSGGLGETQELTITATPLVNLTGAVAFGEVVLSNVAAGNGLPNERIAVAIKGQPGGGTPTPTPGCTPSYTTATSTGVITPGGSDIGNHCDDCTTLVLLPFPVNVYGAPISLAYAGSNGTLQFSAAFNPKPFYFQQCVPVNPDQGGPFLNTLFPNYDDLRTDELVACPDCGIFTQTVGVEPNRQFIIRWKTTYFNIPATTAEFEVLLTEGSDTLSVIYGTTANNGATATSGIQENLAHFTSFSCNQGVLTPSLRVDYIPTGCPTPTPTPPPTPTPTPPPPTPTPTPPPPTPTPTATPVPSVPPRPSPGPSATPHPPPPRP